MMNSTEYLLKAENCAVLAYLSGDAHMRKVYFRMAAIYRNRALRLAMGTLGAGPGKAGGGCA